MLKLVIGLVVPVLSVVWHGFPSLCAMTMVSIVTTLKNTVHEESSDLVDWILMVVQPSWYFLKNSNVGRIRKSVNHKAFRGDFLSKIVEIPGVSWFTGFELEFISAFAAPYEVPLIHYDRLSSEYERIVPESIYGHSSVYFMTIMACLSAVVVSLSGQVVMFIGCVILLSTLWYSDNPSRDWKQGVGDCKFPGMPGLYRVTQTFLGARKEVGVATCQDGILQSRIHLFGVKPRELYYEGEFYKPYTYNTHLDIVSWGGPPIYNVPEDGEEVIVELLRPNTQISVLYTTVAVRMDSGDVMFKGLETVGGVSGSPFFLKKKKLDTSISEVDQWEFAGNVGYNLCKRVSGPTEPWQVELLYAGNADSTKPSTEVVSGGLYQMFNHPGSGKTRHDGPRVIREGLTFCDKIIVAAPTRVVANEWFKAVYGMGFPTSLHIKNSKHRLRNPRVIITTHSTLIREYLSLDKRGRAFTNRTGYIIDEAHFENPHTKMLISLLRSTFTPGYDVKERQKGFYMEMTATGQDLKTGNIIIHEGSNYPITDIEYDNFQETCDVVVANNPGKRILIFCSQARDTYDSVYKVTERLMRRTLAPVVPLHRKIFERAVDYIATKEGKPLVIVSTSLAECGANFDVDIVIDSCTRLVHSPPNSNIKIFKMQKVPVNRAQMIQRRGRVGRQKPGTYYYKSGSAFDINQPYEAMEDDLKVFNRCLELEDNTIMPGEDIALLSVAQLNKWLSLDNDGMQSPRTIRIFYSTVGTPYTTPQIKANLARELLGGNHAIKIGEKTIKVKWWDDRDSGLLKKWLATIGAIPPLPTEAAAVVVVKRLQPLVYRAMEAEESEDPRYNLYQGPVVTILEPDIAQAVHFDGAIHTQTLEYKQD